MAQNKKPGKSKKQESQMLRGLLMFLAIVVLATAAFFVSQKLSTQNSVSPNAPESTPMAAPKNVSGCSGSSAANCQGQSAGDSCGAARNNTKCVAGKQQGNDGLPKCACK